VEAFKHYVESVRTPLAGYRCEILDCVAEGGLPFAKMRFSGRHVQSPYPYALKLSQSETERLVSAFSVVWSCAMTYAS
jgi:hypothetical protein